jgi:hypothetical protein
MIASVLEGEGPLDIPCRMDPAVDAIMRPALPCPACEAPNHQLMPMASAETPATFAIGCGNCEYIGDDAPTVTEAVAKWNHDEQRHAAQREQQA